MKKFVEDSLRNLETDCLDLVQLHCPPTEVYYRPEVFAWLDNLAREGKIRYYGVSVERVEEALKAIEFPGVQTIQIIFNMFRTRPAFRPLKGSVSGKKTGTKFLVRTFTGLGTVAAYLVGNGGSSGFYGPLSESALLRERVANNVGVAGDEELNELAFNQNIVVTVPGNTRFYIVLGTGSGGRDVGSRQAVHPFRQVRKPPQCRALRSSGS